MKIKIIRLSLIAIVLLGCSKGYDSKEILEEIPLEKKLLLNTEVIKGGTLTLEYNSDKTVNSIYFNDQLFFSFTYDGNHVATAEVNLEGGVLNYSFDHNNYGHITSFTANGVVTQLNYDAANKTYQYANGNGDERTIVLTDAGDV